jgi:hypothetical protein
VRPLKAPKAISELFLFLAVLPSATFTSRRILFRACRKIKRKRPLRPPRSFQSFVSSRSDRRVLFSSSRFFRFSLAFPPLLLRSR